MVSELKAAVCPSLFLFFFCKDVPFPWCWKCVSESACRDERKGPTRQLPSQKVSTESLFYGCQMTSCFSCFKIIAGDLAELSSRVPCSALWCTFQCLLQFCVSVVSLQLVFSQQTTLPLSPSNITS